MSNIAKRLDVHFAALAAVGAVAGMGAAQHADAAIVYSGVVNLAVQTTTNGLYLNLVTGAINEPGNTTGAAGWDINIYGSTPTAYGSFNPGYAYVGSGGNVSPLAAGALIDGTTATATGSASMAGFPTTAGAYYGFAFQNEANANQIEYGWALYIKGTGVSGPTGAGTLVSYGYENTGAGINAGAVPAPTAGMGLLALGGAGLLGRRRK